MLSLEISGRNSYLTAAAFQAAFSQRESLKNMESYQ
jgi:hypothetical protein